MNKRSIVTYTSLTIFVISLSFYIKQLYSYGELLNQISINAVNTIVFLISVSLVASMSIFGGMIWLNLLKIHRIKKDTISVISVYIVSQLGKYLPGNIGHHIGRVILAQNISIPVSVTVNTMVIELLAGLFVGLCLSVFSIYYYVDYDLSNYLFIIDRTYYLYIIIVLLAIILIGAIIFRKYAAHFFKQIYGDPITVPSGLYIASKVIGLFLVGFAIMGLILKLHAQYFFAVPDVDLAKLTCLFSIAWLAGYLTPGAPGGLGIREAIMVLLLSPLFGTGTAVGLGVSLRITTTLGDGVAFLLGLLLRRFCPGKASRQATV